MYSSPEVDCRCAAWTYRVHTSHRGSRSEGGWNESQNEHPIVWRVDLVSRAFEQETHKCTPSTCALGATVASFKLLPEKTLTASPLGILPVLDWQVFLFSRAVGPKFVSASKADTVPVSQYLRMRRNHERPQTRCNIFVPSSSSSPQTRPSGKGNAEGRQSSRNS